MGTLLIEGTEEINCFKMNILYQGLVHLFCKGPLSQLFSVAIVQKQQYVSEWT